MVINVDKNQGLIKVYWEDVHKHIAKIEPKFAKIVNELAPDKSFPLYLAYYPYGAIDADTKSSFFPSANGSYYRISDSDAPKDIVKHLGYSKDYTPLSMILEKDMECFIDLKDEKITIPWCVFTPGKIFPFARILNKKNDRVYAPNGLLSSTAGARSAFLLPNIGSAINHSNLQRDFNVQNPPPKSLYEHWAIFKEILNSDVINSDWRCCVMYFSEKWIEKIHNDKSWSDLKHYLHELAWYYYEYEKNRVYYDITFSMIQKKRNLKPNPYLADTARHLFATAIGATPGYAPVLNDHALPLDLIQKVFVESYGLKKYLPTIMQPMHFSFEKDNFPIYYSLQNPSTRVFSPKSREVSSTLFEIRELEHIMKIFVHELSKENEPCSGSIIAKIAKGIKFNYFHNKVDRHRIVRPSTDIVTLDKRFDSINPKYKKNEAVFASDAPFIRGCISISTKD
jgi:hypothetical protein